MAIPAADAAAVLSLRLMSPISNDQANAFLQALLLKSPELVEELKILCGKSQKGRFWDDRSFAQFVAELIYSEAVHALTERSVPLTICDRRFGCKCCESFKFYARGTAYKEADKQITEDLQDPSQDFKLLLEFAELAVQNERKKCVGADLVSLTACEAATEPKVCFMYKMVDGKFIPVVL
jgi:hypothetical protein